MRTAVTGLISQYVMYIQSRSAAEKGSSSPQQCRAFKDQTLSEEQLTTLYEFSSSNTVAELAAGSSAVSILVRQYPDIPVFVRNKSRKSHRCEFRPPNKISKYKTFH